MAIYKKIETMSAEQIRDWLAGKREGEFILLDVRQPAEYRSGHLPGAVFIPLPELLDRFKELDPSKPVVTYCRSGNRSRSAAAILLTEGFAPVYSLDGGITAWNGQVAAGDYREGLYLLEGRKTGEELIFLAWSLEEGSRAFYEKAGEMTSDKEAKDIFSSLARAEEKHKANLHDAYKMVAGKDFGEDLPDDIHLKGIMEGGVQVEDVIGFLKGKDRTVLDAVEVSMELETNALDLYIKMLREIEDKSAQRVFASLVEEEKRHLSMLGELLEGRTG
jgi:sulfur-carrier protein adenylyltransferase/sulfurtransferase